MSMVFEGIGAFTVRLFATAVIVVVLQLAYETVLAFIGFRRFWIARYRIEGRITKPFPVRSAIWAAVTWRLDLGGDYVLGGLMVPADPRKPIWRERYDRG